MKTGSISGNKKYYQPRKSIYLYRNGLKFKETGLFHQKVANTNGKVIKC